jgi:hypothetical protein
MLQTSKDLLFIILGVSIFGFTVFICWAIYYVVMMLRQANDMLTEFRANMKRLEEVLGGIKEKIEHSASYLSLLVEVARQGLTFMREKKEKKGRKSKEE